MLDSATKRRIDTARNILVGKVPDPKSQVEQITIALIYKFMDDMDAEAEELGGKRKFFTGDYARYGWAKLMSAGIGGHELIALYGEGIATMLQNPVRRIADHHIAGPGKMVALVSCQAALARKLGAGSDGRMRLPRYDPGAR